MSLKLIELQIALPRTHDMGKIQEQIHQQSYLMQAHLAMNTQKKEEEARRQITKKAKNAETRWETENKQPSVINKKTFRKKADEEKHPYKGTIIDFTG